MIENAVTFLNYRKKQELQILGQTNNDIYQSIITVEINITELCNRKCIFCPRVDPEIYPNRKLFISDKLIELIIDNLNEINYKGKISFSGFGEPLLNKNFPDIIKKFRSSLDPKVIIETNTNGDKFTPELINEIFDAGIDAVYWNLYDGEHQIEKVLQLIKKSKVNLDNFRLRPHWPGFDTAGNWGLFINNRSGALQNEYNDVDNLPLKQCCNYPFYKLFIDWNGDVLCCSNDWLRKNVIGNVNVDNLKNIWVSEKFNTFRKNLINKDRSQLPCNTCNINGLLFGDKSREILEGLIVKD